MGVLCCLCGSQYQRHTNQTIQRPKQGWDVNGRVNIGNSNNNIRLYQVPTLSKLFNQKSLNFLPRWLGCRSANGYQTALMPARCTSQYYQQPMCPRVKCSCDQFRPFSDATLWMRMNFNSFIELVCWIAFYLLCM